MTTPKIEHVILIVQENRSVDNLFNGFPNADTVRAAQDRNGNVVPLQSTLLETPVDPDHQIAQFMLEYDDGKMDGFGDDPSWPSTLQNAAFAYVNPAETAPYWAMASQYTFADHMFQSVASDSYTAHQYLIAGQDGGAAEAPDALPWGCDAPPGTTFPVLNGDRTLSPGPFPCLDYPTLGDTLDAARVSWKYYAPRIGTLGGDVWTGFDAISHVRYGQDWQKVVSPETLILDDISSGNLPSMSWVIPNLANSDHARSSSASGPSWVTAIVNTVGQSKYWQNTAVIIVWDDWGGWYDHVSPPQLDRFGLGFRVPTIVVSPYSRRGVVSHTQYEFGSILRFVEQVFQLPSLHATDARSTPIDDMFDFTQNPKPFSVIRAPLSKKQILSQPRSFEAPDE